MNDRMLDLVESMLDKMTQEELSMWFEIRSAEWRTGQVSDEYYEMAGELYDARVDHTYAALMDGTR